MPLTSLACLAFLAAAALLHAFLPARIRPLFLLVVSYLFYLTWDPVAAAGLLVLTTLTYWTAGRIAALRESPRAAWLLAFSVGGLIVLLVGFKLRAVLAAGGNLAVPIGLSYTTFRMVGHLMDVSWGKEDTRSSWIDFACYVAFFPQLVAGPIDRSTAFLPQLHPARRVTLAGLQQGLLRILLGCLKKLAIADGLAPLVSFGFQNAGVGSAVPSALAFYLFPLQLYMDFSGLSDIAIGMGMLFGIRSPENFDGPFGAPSISEYWRRWHMSLTGWLRDYVFSTLRMQTRNLGDLGLALSVTINMMLIALWHGLTMAFVVFGVINSLYLVVDALTAQRRKRYYKKHPRAARFTDLVGPFAVYHMVALANVFVRASNVSAGFRVLAGFAAGVSGAAASLASALAPPNHYATGLLLLALVATLLDYLRRKGHLAAIARAPRWLRWSVAATTVVLCAFLVISLVTRRGEVNPFIYEKF